MRQELGYREGDSRNSHVKGGLSGKIQCLLSNLDSFIQVASWKKLHYKKLERVGVLRFGLLLSIVMESAGPLDQVVPETRESSCSP